MSDDMIMEDVYAKFTKARGESSKQCRNKTKRRNERILQGIVGEIEEIGMGTPSKLGWSIMQVVESATTKRRSPRLQRHQRRLVWMGMKKHSRIVFLPRNKKYAGMLTEETNLQSYVCVRVMK
jgi:ribosomal protein L30/L7E